jgi:hypothetical protein
MPDQNEDLALAADGVQLDIQRVQQPNAMDVLQQAVQAGVADAATLEALQTLVHREEDRREARAFNKALAAFQRECPTIAKKQTATVTSRSGGSFAYTFASLADIVSTIRPLLVKHGLSYTWDSDESDPSTIAMTCHLRHVDGHATSSTVRLLVDEKAASRMNTMQASGSAISYAKRYSLVAALGIVSADPDDDAASAGPTSTEPISDAQVEQLGRELDERGADMEKFLAYFGVDSLGEITVGRFDEALKLLRRKPKVAS